MRHVLLRKSAEFQLTASRVSLLVAGGSAWLSFLAFKEFMAGTDLPAALQVATAAVTAAVTGAIMHLNNLMILGGLPHVDRLPRHRFLPLVGATMLLTTMFSTYPNVVTTSGNDAMRLHRAREMDELVIYGTDLQRAAQMAGQLGPNLQQRASRFADLANCEAASGCLTGTPGAGDLTDALNSAAGKVEDTAANLVTAHTAIEKLVPMLTAAYALGDDLAVRRILAEMRANIPTALLNATAANLRSDLGIEGTARNRAVRARQDQAIAQLQTDLAGTADALVGMSERVEEASSSLTLPGRQSITKAGAIWRYLPELLPQVAVGVAIDWALVIAAFFMGMLRDATPKPDDDVSDISLADAHRIHRELSNLIRDIGGEDAPEPSKPRPEPGKPTSETADPDREPLGDDMADPFEHMENVFSFGDWWKKKPDQNEPPPV